MRWTPKDELVIKQSVEAGDKPHRFGELHIPNGYHVRFDNTEPGQPVIYGDGRYEIGPLKAHDERTGTGE